MTDAESDEAVGPPVLVLGLGGLAVIVSAALLFVGTLSANVTGYVLASFLPVVCVGLFRRFDLARRANPLYHAREAVSVAVPMVMAAAFIVAALHTWPIATDLAS